MASVTQQDTKDNTSVTLDTSKFHCHSMGLVVLLGLPVKTAPPAKSASRQNTPGKVKMVPGPLTNNNSSINHCQYRYYRCMCGPHEGRFDLQKQIGKGLF